MNTTTDVASSPASNELVTVLGRSFVLDGETLIVDALVVYKNGKGSPKAIDVATPFLSGTNVRPGRVMPTKSIYEPNTGTYHFEIPVEVNPTSDMLYNFTFNITVDGVMQQVELGGQLTASSHDYSMKSTGIEFEGDKLVAGFEITSRNGEEIFVATAKPNILVRLANRTANGPEVIQKGNQVFLKWNANINNSAAQIFIASGLLNVGTTTVGYSVAFETKPVSIESSEIKINGKELELTFNLSESCEGPFTIPNLSLKENGKVVKTVTSTPVVIGRQVSIRLVRTIPTRNKIEYTVTGGIALGGNYKRMLPFEFETTDFVKVDLPESPQIEVENISHSYSNGVEKAVFKFTLNNAEHTPLINVDGLRLDAPADLSTRNTVDYDPATGELTVERHVSSATGILTTRGTILAYDYSDDIIEGEFHSSIAIEADIYRPARTTTPTFNPIVYAGGDTDVGIVIPVCMANGEAPLNAKITSVLSFSNLDVANLVNRHVYNNNGTISFQIAGTRLNNMVGKVYSLSVMIDVETPNGVSSIPVYIEHSPSQRSDKPELVLAGTSNIDENRRVALTFKLTNIGSDFGKGFYVGNDSFEGLNNVVIRYVQADQVINISGDVPEGNDHFIYSGDVILKSNVSEQQYVIAIPGGIYSRPGKAEVVGSHYNDGVVELSWIFRDGMGLVPADIVLNKNSWAISENLGSPVGHPRYNAQNGVLTQAFKSLEGNVDSIYSVKVKYQYPMPDANVYWLDTTFDHKKSDKATRIIGVTQDGVMVDPESMTATVFYDMSIPNGIAYQDLRIANMVNHNDTAAGGIISHDFSSNRLVVTVAISPAKVNNDFVADFRLDITGPNARGHAETVITTEKTVDRFTIIDAAYHKEGFVRFYGKAPQVDVARLGHVVKSVSNDVTNYPPSVICDVSTGLIFIDYPVKSNEFVGRTYSVEGVIDLGDVQEHYKAHKTIKAIKPMYNNFILTQGGSSVDYKQGVMKINFNIEAIGTAGLGIPQEVGITVVAKEGQFNTHEEVIYELDPATGKGHFIVHIHDRSSVRYPNAELKVRITSPNVGNDYNGTITGFSGQDNTCEIISVRHIPNKGEIVFRAGVGYGYPTATRPTMVNFLSGFQYAEGIEPGVVPHDVEYSKDTGILEFRVKGNARPVGDVLYAGLSMLGVVDAKGKSTQIPVNIHTVIRDGNEARHLSAEVIGVETFQGRSQFTIRLGYTDYLYPPTAPAISCSASNVSIEYDKVKGLAQVTITGDIYPTYASSVGGVLYITDELSNVSVSGNRENVMTRVALIDSNGPEGITQLSHQWVANGIVFSLPARVQGKKPIQVDLVENIKSSSFNITDPSVSYNVLGGIISVFVPASKPKFAALSIRGKLVISLDGVNYPVDIDSGMIYPEGITHIVSCGYNTETKRVMASWVIYGVDGKHPAKVNLGTKEEWVNTSNLSNPRPTKEQYNPETGIYYAEFAPAQRIVGQRVFKGSTKLNTGKESIPVSFSVVI